MNLIIVESENDRYFIEKLIDVIHISNFEVEKPICKIDEYDCIGGIGNLEKKLQEVRLDKYEKLGIIIDADKDGIQNRIEFINKAIKKVCKDVELTKINEFKKSRELDIDIACYITNIDGYGELENILIKIKSKDSTYADCLVDWRNCLKIKGKSISDKEYNKFWINNYFRFDTCTQTEQKQAGKKCNNEAAIKKDIWDFSSPLLDELKSFLNLFE